MHELSKLSSPVLLDLLIARLDYERTAIKLYDAVITKLRESPDVTVPGVAHVLERHSDEEREHEQWLEEQIHALGGDVHGTSEMSRLEAIESKGLEEIVLQDDREPLHLLHALLAAELADNSGWELLVQIADEVGDREAKLEFRKRLHEEEAHLVFVRRVIERIASQVVLGRVITTTAVR